MRPAYLSPRITRTHVKRRGNSIRGRGRRDPAQHDVSRQTQDRPGGEALIVLNTAIHDCPYLGQDAKKLHSNLDRRSSHSGNDTLRPHQRPHSLPRALKHRRAAVRNRLRYQPHHPQLQFSCDSRAGSSAARVSSFNLSPSSLKVTSTCPPLTSLPNNSSSASGRLMYS